MLQSVDASTSPLIVKGSYGSNYPIGQYPQYWYINSDGVASFVSTNRMLVSPLAKPCLRTFTLSGTL